MPMNVRCPQCRTLFRVDPARVPESGANARCSRCGDIFEIRPPAGPPSQPEPEGASRVPDGGERPESHGAGGARPTPTRAAGSPAEPRAPSETPGGRDAPDPDAGVAPATTEAPEVAGEGETPGGGEPPGGASEAPAPGGAAGFGEQDAGMRARRIARALVSDIVAYHSDRVSDDADPAAVRRAFRGEILKSWDEYVAQVGKEMAESTPHFRNALNEMLAGGREVF